MAAPAPVPSKAGRRGAEVAAEVARRRRLPGAALAAVFALGGGFGLASDPPAGLQRPDSGNEAEAASVGALRNRARDILAGVQERRVALPEARRQVERLLRDLKAAGEAEGWKPVHRRLELTIARPEELSPTLAEDCPLFFEEELVRLCPLDQSRSEIWGNQVLVCEFACAPETGPTEYPEE